MLAVKLTLTNQTPAAPIFALGVGGVLTVAWTGLLFWIAGYLIGCW